MTAMLYHLPTPEERDACGLLETLLVDDAVLWEKFEAVCLGGVVELRETVLGFRSVLLEKGHVFDTHEKQFEETYFALLTLADDLLSDSPGAARARLRRRVSGSVTRLGGGVKIAGEVDCLRAVGIVLAHEDAMFDEVVLASKSHTRLYATAARIQWALASIGRKYPSGDVEDALVVLVQEIAPKSPAARPNAERMYEMWCVAQEYVDARPGLDEAIRQSYEVAALEAAKAQDLPAYRNALKELCRAANAGNQIDNGETND